MRCTPPFSRTFVRTAVLAALLVALGLLGQPGNGTSSRPANDFPAPSTQAQAATPDLVRASSVARSVDRMAWLAGCWEGTLSNGATYEEAWLTPRGGTLIGMARMVRDDQTQSFEFMRIVDDDGTLVFIAHPSAQEPTEFHAVGITSVAATFENPDHDFPQRVLYRLNQPDELLARVEGDRDGELRGLEFPMRRAACAG